VLVTSRQPLHLPGEHELAVGPMTLPEGARTVAAFAGCEAVRLFVERSAAVRPGFIVTAENAGDVREICKHLDGIPLAIELAASRLRVLSPRELARKLTDRLTLLKDDTFGLPPRQRTLVRTIEWSYDLLSEDEQLLFQMLSVFVGGFTLQALERVCFDPGAGRDSEALDCVAALVEKNLVRREEVDGGTRFGLLETIAEYARFRFIRSPRAPEVRRKGPFGWQWR
jgi:predicted ATPase